MIANNNDLKKLILSQVGGIAAGFAVQAVIKAAKEKLKARDEKHKATVPEELFFVTILHACPETAKDLQKGVQETRKLHVVQRIAIAKTLNQAEAFKLAAKDQLPHDTMQVWKWTPADGEEVRRIGHLPAKAQLSMDYFE